MAMVKPINPMEVQDIQRKMAEIRHDMHGEVMGAVEGVRLLTDWRAVLRGFPLVTVGIAAAVGYFIVPRRREAAPTIVALDTRAPALAAIAEPQKSGAGSGRSSWGVMGAAFSLLAPIALRAAQNYAMNFVEEWLAGHQFAPQESDIGPRPRAARAATATPIVGEGRFRDRR